MRTTRRTAVTASGAAVLGLAGCTADEPATAPSATPGVTTATTAARAATTAAPPDPDRVALDRAVRLTASLLALLEGSPAAVDPGGRLAALHTAHLRALEQATAGDVTPETGSGPSGRTTSRRLRRRELAAQRELAGLAQRAESGALARVFASMSAGIAAGLARQGGGLP